MSPTVERETLGRRPRRERNAGWVDERSSCEGGASRFGEGALRVESGTTGGGSLASAADVRHRPKRRQSGAAGSILGSPCPPSTPERNGHEWINGHADRRPLRGGFADSSYWVPVIEDLQAHDLPGLALPAEGLDHDAEYIASFVNQIDGPVLLVGHS